MAIGTFPGMLQEGTHAARPAATAVGSGALYACSDHALIYQSDGATWSTWATLGAGGGALFPLIGDPPSYPNTADRDFRGAADLGNYTAVGISAGTVVLHETTTTAERYELTDAGLLIQVGHAQLAEFRADYTLPDTQSMIIAISGGPHLQAGDNMAVALRLNDNDTSSISGNWISCGLEQDTTEFVVQGNSSIDSAGFEYTLPVMHLPPMILFRIVRAGLVYRSYVSLNGGATWSYVDTDTFGAALTNVWIAVLGASTGQVSMPTVRVPFIVEGTDDYDPW